MFVCVGFKQLYTFFFVFFDEMIILIEIKLSI